MRDIAKPRTLRLVSEIVLHQPPGRPWGTPNMSPFCAKLECYLRITEIPYKVGAFSRSQAPKGKIPYVEIDGKFMGDSQLIIEQLEGRLKAEGKRALDDGLAPRDRATARLIRRAIEEGSYFVGMYSRWKTDEGYAPVREEFKKFVPGFVVPFIRRDVHKKLHHQGTGRHTVDEAMAIGSADFDAVAEMLGDRPFLFGDEPRTVDCTLFGFLEATLGPPIESPIKKTAMSHSNLVGYRKRIRDRWWKDLA